MTSERRHSTDRFKSDSRNLLSAGSTSRAIDVLSRLLTTGARVSVVLLLLSGAAQAVPITVDFALGGSAGNLGTSSATINGVVVDGFYFNSTWQAANLFRRNDDDDHGFGICNPAETCVSTTSQGDINELDNAGLQELIRLTLPDGFRWLSVRLSSLDENDEDDPVERGQLFSDIDGDPATAFDKLLRQFEASGSNVEPSFPIEAVDQFAQYLFFRPFDWQNGTNFNNDFLVWQVRIDSRVPEPGTLGLLTAGLLGLGLAWRRKTTEEKSLR